MPPSHNKPLTTHVERDVGEPFAHITLDADLTAPIKVAIDAPAVRLDDVPACARVLGTNELLEQILIRLPLKSIVRTQAISRAWRDLINHSSIVQQALFLAPAKPRMVWTLVDKEVKSPNGPGGSGLLGPAAAVTELSTLMTIDEAKDNGAGYLIQAKVNGVLPYRHLHFSQRLDSSHAVWSFCNQIHPESLPAETAFSTNINAIKRLRPVCRDMYMTQPPSKIVEIGVYGGGSLALVGKVVCEDPVGITFQHVIDVVGKLQATRAIACVEVAFWMNDVSFVRQTSEPGSMATAEPLGRIDATTGPRRGCPSGMSLTEYLRYGLHHGPDQRLAWHCTTDVNSRIHGQL
ncbi:hypothetical protein LTR53_011140 [Teratosphaeriaceae sp. CCFEE 6253]|nr:hypothetical protein LTR53_011140 [Teratosphaeriaceae sp. CCFEE 6253]